jgi:hypothetical protein
MHLISKDWQFAACESLQTIKSLVMARSDADVVWKIRPNAPLLRASCEKHPGDLRPVGA